MREGVVDSDGVKLAYRRYGDGSDMIVVLHGGPGLHAGYLEPDLAPLTDGRTVIFYDQRGGGRSTVPANASDLDAMHYVEDLDRIRIHFGLQSLVLVGHSWGGLLAGLYAHTYPERVSRLLLIDPDPPKRDPFWGAINARLRLDDTERRRLGTLMEAWRVAATNGDAVVGCRGYWDLYLRGHFFDPAKQHRLKGDLCAASLQSFLGVNRTATRDSLGAWNLTPGLSACRCPTLVIHGRNDPVPLDGSRLWAESLPEARLLIIDAAGHFPYVEQPDDFFRAAETFLRGGWPPSAQRVKRLPTAEH